MWRLTLKDGQVLDQYDQDGQERLLDVDRSMIEVAAWVPRNGEGPSHQLMLEEGQWLIIVRRHAVGPKTPDRVILYLLGYWQDGNEAVLYITPEGSTVLIQGNITEAIAKLIPA